MLLAFRVDAGDAVLKQHLATAGKNATYISKMTQNALIRLCGDVISDHIVADVTKAKFFSVLCGDVISDHIVADVAKAKFFSVLCDETTDSSHQEQLCVCLRFIDSADDKHRIREEFVQFQSAVDLTGDGLATNILSILCRQLQLNRTTEKQSTKSSVVRAMTDCTFIMSLCCAYKVMALTIVLSRSL